MVSSKNILSTLVVLILASDKGATCQSDGRDHVKDPDTIDANNPGVTMVPTKTPTSSPTNKPTEQPSRIPTDSPTMRPTAEPTRKPTSVPTFAPTSNPTTSPTAEPTRKPTSVPTFAPTSNPTTAPTSLPSVIPTTEPSSTLSFPPSLTPSENPSALPSVSSRPSQLYEPSASPSKSPSPSKWPSRHPSVAPSSEKSPSPTENCIDISKDFDNIFHHNVSHCDALYYAYEIETSPNTTVETLESDIVPAIEQEIANSLLPLLVGKCGEDEDSRRLVTLNSGLQRWNRQLDIFGISSSPEDVRPEQADGECQFQTSVDNECSVVFGAMTICGTNLTADKISVIYALEAGMHGDEYIDAHQDIVEIRFVSGDVNGLDLRVNPSKSATDNTEGLSPMYWAIIAGVSVTMFVLIFAGRRMLREENDEEAEEKSVGSDTIPGQDEV